jgi:GxxExxY protein
MGHDAHNGRDGHDAVPAHVEDVGRVILDAAFKVHRALGPGMLESTYEHCLAHELGLRGVPFKRQVSLPVTYEGLTVDAGYRMDLVGGDSVVVEIKATDTISRLFEAQLLTYLRLSGLRLGYLMNFNVELLRDGVRRRVR